MSDFLQTMASSSRARAATARTDFQSSDFDQPVVALALGAFDVIAEIKDRSPAEGELKSSNDTRQQRAQAYAAGGAAAISVLTEPSRFDGDLAHLAEVVEAVPSTPVMRKDFLVEPVQVLEARQAGASGVLLIAAMLSDEKLGEMLACAWEHQMFVLLEAFDADDLRRSSLLLEDSHNRDRADNAQLLIGVNTRNLRTLTVDSARLASLAPALPAAHCVAESGLRVSEDAARVSAMGYKLALVGTALMRSDDPSALIASMREAGA
jgi:indole-3-glycerol phosphate synthase